MYKRQVLEQKAQRSTGIALEDLLNLDADEQLGLLHRKLVSIGLLSPLSKASILKGPVRVYETASRDDYRPNSVYADDAKLILLEDPKLDQQENERSMLESKKRWQHWIPNMRYLRGPGNHMTALQPPHVQDLSDWILTDLDQDKCSL